MILTILFAGTTALLPVNNALLKGLPQQIVAVNDHGTKRQCSGVLLTDILARNGIPQRDDLRGKSLERSIVIHARDGYAVLFSLGEIAPTLGNNDAIIATRCNGKILDEEEGPFRVIVSGDSKMARSVRQVELIEIR